MLIKKLFKKLDSKPKSNAPESELSFIVGQKEIKINKKVATNKKNIKYALSSSEDIKEKEIEFGKGGKIKATLIYIDGLADIDIISETVLRSLTADKNTDISKISPEALLEKVHKKILCSSEITETEKISESASACLKGDSALFIEGCKSALLLNTKGGEKRSITEPQSESVVRGPREGFTESFRTNTAMIRRKIRNGNLKVEELVVGKKTQTKICIIYLNEVARPEIVEKVRSRIENLKVESILESGYIEQYIENYPFSIFPTVDYSEKPDVIAAKLLEGRVAIVIDGTPFVLTVPMLFVETFQTAEDYYHRPIYATFIRLFRYFAYFVSIFGPAIYIALTNFHQELIPTTLLFSIIKSKEGTPFPVFIETLIMVLAFEFLREGGIRLPRSVGQAISIVGALIMGEAAVSAGIVGAPVVIVVAFTAVCGFFAPSLNNSSSIIRLVMMILAAFTGLYGVSIGFLVLLINLANLESFGVPYCDTYSNLFDAKDTLVRMPLWANLRRPTNLSGDDKTRGNLFIPPRTNETFNKDEQDKVISEKGGD